MLVNVMVHEETECECRSFKGSNHAKPDIGGVNLSRPRPCNLRAEEVTLPRIVIFTVFILSTREYFSVFPSSLVYYLRYRW